MQIQDRIFKIARETFELENKIENLTCDLYLKDFGINSLLFIKLLVSLENEFDIEFDHASLDYNKLKTINEISNYINIMLSKKQSSLVKDY